MTVLAQKHVSYHVGESPQDMPLCREEEAEELAWGRDICLERCPAVSHQPSAAFCMMKKKKK